MTTNKDLQYWVGFSLINGIGRVKLAQIENYFGRLENAWLAPSGDFKKAGLESNIIKSIEANNPEFLDNLRAAFK